MENERIDNYPEYNMFFSPNWFSHQILYISEDGLCIIGCNDEAQIIDLNKKKSITSIFITIPDEILIKDANEKKITAVFLNNNYLVFCLLKGLMAIYKKEDDEWENVFTGLLQYEDQIAFIKEIKSNEDEIEFLLADTKSLVIFGKYSNGQVDQEVLWKQGKTSSIKFLDYIEIDGTKLLIKICDDGIINIWTTYFEEMIFFCETKCKFNSISCKYFDGNNLIISGLTKSNHLYISQIVIFKIIDTYNLTGETVNPDPEKYKIIMNIEFEIEFNENDAKYIKLKFYNKIQIVDYNHILITSRDGSLFYIDISELSKLNDKLNLSPKLTLEENNIYEILVENPHSKNIYFNLVHKDNLILIGMDRIISFWNILEFGCSFNFSIKCWGSKINKVKTNPNDKNSILLLSNDKTMRIWDIGKKSNYFVSSIIHKGLQNKVIKNIEFHPQDEGIIACISDSEIFLYNIYGHNLINGFKNQTNDPLNYWNSRWIPKTLIELFLDNKFNKLFQKILNLDCYKNYYSNKNKKMLTNFKKYNQKFNKSINNEYALLVYSNIYGFWIYDFNLGGVVNLKTSYEYFSSAIDIYINWKPLFCLVIIGDKKGNLVLIKLSKQEYNYHFIPNLHHSIISSIKISNINELNGNIRFATGSYDKKIQLFEINNLLDNKLNNKNVVLNYGTLIHNNKINEIQYSPFDWNILMNTCHKHATIQIWNISREIKEKNKEKESKERCICNIRGHKAFVTSAAFSEKDKNMIISASDDQSCKVWDYINIKNISPPDNKRETESTTKKYKKNLEY